MRRVSMVFMLMCSLVSTQASAQDSAVRLIPDTASVVVRLKNPQATTEKVSKFANQIQPGADAAIETWSNQLGAFLSNPTLAGVDKNADWWLVVSARADAEPQVVFVVPATDGEMLSSAIGESFHAIHQDGWVIYSEDVAALEPIQQRIDGQGESIIALIDSSSREVLQRGDISVFVHVASLTKLYESQLDEADQQLDEVLDNFAQLVPPTPGMDLEPVIRMYSTLGHGLLQAIRDTKAFSVTLTVGAEDIAIEEFVTVVPDSQTDNTLKKYSASELPLLDKLPVDQLAYFGLRGDMNGLMEWGMNIWVSMSERDEASKSEEMQRIISSLKAVEFGDYVGSFDLGDLEGGALDATILIEATPADKLRQFYNEIFDIMNEWEVAGVKQQIEVEREAETYGSRTADVITVVQEIDPSLDPFGFQKRMIEFLYGAEGMKQRLVYVDNGVVQTLGDPETMKTALDRLDSNERAPKTARDTARSRLLSEANIVALVDLPGIAVKAMQLVAESGTVPNLPITAETVAQLKSDPSYMGVSITSKPAALHCKASFPVTQFQGIFKIVQFFQGLRQAPPL